MCEIQLIKRTDNNNLTDADLKQFKKMMTLGNVYNNNAYGFFNNNTIFKDSGEFDKLKFSEKSNILLKNNFVIGHNRLATQGDKNKNFNNHPFILNGFILVHNGIIQNHFALIKEFKVKTKIETDSFIILWLINHYFKISDKKTRQKKIIDAIKKTCLKIIGSYSVFLYDKKENSIYYFKNDVTSFYFALYDNKILLGSTNKENFDSLYLKKNLIFVTRENKILTKKAKDNAIYLINDLVKIKEIGSFKSLNAEKEKIPFSNGYIDYDYKNFDYSNNDEYNDLMISDLFLQSFGYLPIYYYDKKNSKVYLDFNKNVLKDVKALGMEFKLKKNKIVLDIRDFTL